MTALPPLRARGFAKPRLGPADWAMINAALAFYEAEDLEDEAEAHGVDLDAYAVQIRKTRHKVWARL